MRFTAIPVSKGDAFLFQIENIKVLVDAGNNQDEVYLWLKKKDILCIDIFICTHYDQDHINGLIGLLKNKIQINELWLPEIQKYISNVCKSAKNILKQIDDLCINADINKKIYKYKVKTIIKKSLRLNQELNLVPNTTIRYFKYEGNYVSNHISSNLYTQNCTEINTFINIDLNQLFLMINSIRNAESLVFKYQENDKPNILFSGDSSFNFNKNIIIRLSNGSIVTAPHHGSKTSDKLYSQLVNHNSLIFVRSDKKTNIRPCIDYKKLNEKYCTTCNYSNQVEVEFNFNGIKFFTKNNKCNCK